MDPFDPKWNFEALVTELNERHRPGSLTSGKTRNALVRAWALCVGRDRAQAELQATIAKFGSRSALGKALSMTPGTLAVFETFFRSVPPRGVLPEDAPALRAAVESLSPTGRADFFKVATELLQDAPALRRLAALPDLSILGTAIRAMDLQLAVNELSETLDAGDVREATYQDWCDRHSWAFGNAHVVRDELRRLDASNTVDLLLPNLVGYRDVVELKRPDAQVLGWDRSHKTHYFTASCSRAIGQVHKYMDRLHEVAKHGLEGHPHVLGYHPQAIIVMGRSNRWSGEETRSLRGLNERLHGITVMTYDHLLAQARQLLSTVGAEQTAARTGSRHPQ